MEERGSEGKRRPGPSPFQLISLFLFIATSLSAQSLPLVRCDALVGFNGIAREGRFAPVIVSVESSNARVSVVVELEVTWGSSLRANRGSRSFTRETLLADGATRRLPFLIPVPSDARSLTVSVTSDGTELARQDVDLRSQTTTDRLVAGISSELTLDALAGLSDGTGAVRLVYPRIDDLPETWAGYDGVDMVVVHDTYFQQLRSTQVAALEKWVVTGGTLVFTGGSAALQHAGAGLARLLPVEVTGLIQRDGLPSIASLAGAPRGPQGGMVLAESRPTTGTIVVAAEEGMPVMVRRALGRGTIWFTAFDPTLQPLASWEGTLALWRLMAGRDRQPTLGAGARDPMDDPWMKAILGAPPLSFPSAVSVFIFFASYFALLFPLLAGRTSRRLTARLRAIFLAIIPLAACLYGWIAFNQVLFRPEPQVLESSRVEARSGDGLALVTERIGLVTAMPGAVEVSLGSPEATVDEESSRTVAAKERDSADRSMTVALNERTTIHGLALPRFGTRLYIFSDVVPYPVTAEVSPQGSTLRVAVSNTGARSLRGCFFLRNGRGYPIGDIAAGSKASRSFETEESVDARSPEARAKLTGDARKDALWSLDAESVDAGSGVIVGWLDDSLLPVSFSGAVRAIDRPALTLVLVEMQ